jgi:hypothetical protein
MGLQVSVRHVADVVRDSRMLGFSSSIVNSVKYVYSTAGNKDIPHSQPGKSYVAR